MLLVNQIIPFSNVDGDGNRCSIFLQGCNIHCVYCHNSQTINLCNNCGLCLQSCPSDALSIKKGQVLYDDSQCIHCDRCLQVCPTNSTPKAKSYTIDAMVELIESYRPYIRGITVSGGEPTLQSEGVTELFSALGHSGLTRYIDTNGFTDLSRQMELLAVTDGFLFDVKALTSQEGICQATSDHVLSNLALLKEKKKLVEVRTVVFKDLVDTENVIKEVARILGPESQVAYRLIRGHLTGLRQDQKDKLSSNIPTEDDMEALRDMALKAGLSNVSITL